MGKGFKEKKKKAGRMLSFFALLAVGALAIGVMGAYSRSPEQRVKKQLTLGDRYLSELSYEQAIAAYGSALSIDPKSSDAKLGLLEAYAAMAEGMRSEGTGDRNKLIELYKTALSIGLSGDTGEEELLKEYGLSEEALSTEARTTDSADDYERLLDNMIKSLRKDPSVETQSEYLTSLLDYIERMALEIITK